ncbi:MAG TPA: S41 family peptidase [Salinimicrobium sp.]|nr:S41 family peptidase [Salinimicrobium sp.]
MKKIQISIILVFSILLVSCFEDMDDVVGDASSLEVKDFIWKGLNHFYLYKSDVPNLANDRFDTQQELNGFLNNYSSPSNLFSDLLSPQDRFSFLVSNYVALEQALDGISKHNGMEFGLVRYSENSSMIFGYVRYVLPNSSAESQGVQRGMIFNQINGVQLTDSNYSELISAEEYAIGLATLNGTEINSTGQTITLNKIQYSENPVFTTEIVEIENEKIGYLMYNGFTSTYNSELNAVFADFQAEGITNLVLDLRYNGGGSVETAKDLASMITGQFEGEVFATEQWNNEMQDFWIQENPGRLINYFDNQISTGAQINSLNLSRVYILTTISTASASELIINGLNPYIDVVQIGTATTGKFQASITLYDSPDYGRVGANPGHTYAMQPLVLKTINSVGNTDYINGLDPNILLPEDFSNLGELGNPQEPLFAAAINHILGNLNDLDNFVLPMEIIGETKMNQPFYQKMYVEPVDSFE